MKRVIVAALMSAAAFLCTQRAVHAAPLCAAALSYQRVGPPAAADKPSAMYGIELVSRTPQDVSASTLVFDTSGGWFTAAVPQAVLEEKVRRYHSDMGTFSHVDYVSPVMYVQLPKEVQVSHAWVYSAAVNGGTQVTCDTPPGSSSDQQHAAAHRKFRPLFTLDPRDEDALSRAPASDSLILHAETVKPLESSDCAEPFSDASVKRQAMPQYPSELAGAFSIPKTTSIRIDVGPDGRASDAQVWMTSGFAPFDDAALAAAKASTYNAARSYCKAVPASYYFNVTFAPN